MTAIATAKPAATNRAPDPSFEGDITGFPIVNTTYTSSYDTTIKQYGTRSYKTVRDNGTGNSISAVQLTPNVVGNAYKIPAAPGEIISVSCQIRCDVPNWRARLDMTSRTSTGAAVDVKQGTLVSLLPANTWQTITMTYPATLANTAYIFITGNVFHPGSVVLGEQAWFDGLMVNTGPTPEPYFDGDTPGCSWAGEVYGSATVRAALVPWSRWNGTTTEPLTVAGVWNGTSTVAANLTDISVVA